MSYDYARIDGDGFIVALVNSAHVPTIAQQSNVVPAPADDPPVGQLWRWDADLGWGLLSDPRGTMYVNPDTGELLTISHPLQTPPPGWELVTGDLPEPAPTIPRVVSRAQGKGALMAAGLWSAVVAYVESIADSEERAWAELSVYDVNEWERDSPFLLTAATALGLTEQQVNDLFVAAAQIRF